MQRVTGIGGLFFRAQNPAALAAWYEQHLGVTQAPQSYDDEPWRQEAGPTILAPFDDQNDYLGRFASSFILNFRVHDLDAMLDQLRSAGIEVELDPEEYPNGRFAHLRDPEGYPIQLWQMAKLITHD